jgi:hypothetical protein
MKDRLLSFLSFRLQGEIFLRSLTVVRDDNAGSGHFGCGSAVLRLCGEYSEAVSIFFDYSKFSS